MLISTQAGREQEVYSRLGRLKELSEIVMVSGEYDILARIRTDFSGEVSSLVNSKINAIPGIAKVHSLLGRN